RGSGSRSPRGLAGGAAAGFDGAVDVAGPAGGGLGARPVQRPDGPAERRAEAGEGPGGGEGAVAAARVLLRGPVPLDVGDGIRGARPEVGGQVGEDPGAALR